VADGASAFPKPRVLDGAQRLRQDYGVPSSAVATARAMASLTACMRIRQPVRHEDSPQLQSDTSRIGGRDFSGLQRRGE